MKEVFLEGDLDSILLQLYQYRLKGEHVYCMYEGVRLESDSISRESALISEENLSDVEFSSLSPDDKDKFLKKLVEHDRLKNGIKPVTRESIIEGIKYICEHQDDPVNELAKGLLELGCNFNMTEVKQTYPDIEEILLFEGISKGNIGVAASIIINVTHTIYGIDYCRTHFLCNNGEPSLYNFIRIVTGDDSYTMDEVLNKIHSGKVK